MNEWEQAEKESSGRMQPGVEERLAAYYGPQLPEQPLSSTSWERLRSRLGPQHAPKRRRMWRPRSSWLRRDRSDPAYIRETFVRIMHEARVSYPLSLMQCSFNTRVRVPSVRVSAYGRHAIKLVLPSTAEQFIGQTELDVLVATGLARYVYVRKPLSTIVRSLIVIICLLAIIASILLWKYNDLFVVLPIAIGFCASWLLHIQGRKLAFRADGLVVRWLGREATCQGLHALADRSRSPRRGQWGEPSLAERINRVCGTRVTVEEDRLMLVR